VALASGDAGGTGQPRDGDEGCPGRPEVCATGGYGLITVSSRSMQRVHAAGPSVPSSHGYDRGRAGRARPQSEVTGPVPVRDL